jgi:hypothetical protein
MKNHPVLMPIISAALCGCVPALVGITFRLDGENSAVVSYRYDIDKLDVAPGEIPCIASEFANVSR